MSKDEPAFEELTLEHGGKRVTWEYIGEGHDGDYNPKDPNDTPLLRFSCRRWDTDAFLLAKVGFEDQAWVEMQDASYCTRMPITTPVKVLAYATAVILEAIQDVNYKRRLEELSWFCPEDFKFLEQAGPPTPVPLDAPKLPAECHSDDHCSEVPFNCWLWAQQASDDDLMALATCGFGGDYPADNVAMFMADHDPKVAAMFTYIETYNEGHRAHIGFECHVDSEPLMTWMKTEKPRLYARIKEVADADEG